MGLTDIDKIKKEVIRYMVRSNNYKNAFSKYPRDLLGSYVSYKIETSCENAFYFNNIFKGLKDKTYKDIQLYIEQKNNM